jgi:hypothetical protein
MLVALRPEAHVLGLFVDLGFGEPELLASGDVSEARFPFRWNFLAALSFFLFFLLLNL